MMRRKIVRVLLGGMACIMLVLAGTGDLEVRAENNIQNDIEEQVDDQSQINSDNPNDQEDFDKQESIEKKEQILSTVEKITLTIGESYQIEVNQEGDGELSYESSDLSVAEIDENGFLTAYSAGEVNVRVMAAETDNYKSAQILISVEVEKKTCDISAEDMQFDYGDEPRRVVLNVPENAIITYAIDNPDIAEVDNDGNVTPLKVGKTKLYITVEETEEYKACECECNIIVNTTLLKPVLLKASGTKEKITISWEKTEGAEGYYLYEKTGSGKYKILAIIEDADVCKYIREDVKSSTKYSYQIEAFSDEGKNISERSNTKTGIYLLAPSVEVKRTGNAVNVKWSQVTGATGYYLYRKTSKDKNWKQMAKITAAAALTWTDKSPAQGVTDYYYVKAYYSDSSGVSASSKSIYFLKSPSIKSFSRKSKSKNMTVKWSRNTTASGYQIQYADNRMFHSAKTVTIKKNSIVSKKISGLSKSKTYYIRIRAYKTVKGKKYYSDWTLSSNAKKTKTASYTRLKYKKKTFELKGKAKQSVGGYDTVQGGCSDGKYAYYTLYNRKVEKCKIVKVKLSNMKVSKVSGILEIAHGNDMTYNSSMKRLVVTHTNVYTKRISIVNPSTLKIERTLDVKIPAKMSGVSDKDLKNVKGFAGIAYNAKRKQYVTFLKSTGDFMILDKNFNPISYIKPTSKSTLTKQGIDVTDDYILVSYSGSTNIIMVYNWEGQYVTRINVKKGYEIENIFHVGKQYYATFYTSYYKNKKLCRDNYVYKIGSF